MAVGRPEAIADIGDVDLTGTTALVTGGTDGIGRETALALGRLGATVLVHGRDRAKGERVLERLRESGTDADLYLASFERMAAVEELATAIASEHDRLDVLVNNAGGYFGEDVLTPDGVERTFAVNHLAPFVLTATLLPELRDGSGQVVTVSSEAHRGGDFPIEAEDASAAESTRDVTLDLDALRSTSGYSGWDAYCRSKLANVLFTMELAERVEPTAVTANCCHPGIVLGSGFTRNMAIPARILTAFLSRTPDWIPKPVVDTAAEAAATQTYLTASPALTDVTGSYFRDCERDDPDERAADAALRQALWDASAALAGVDPATFSSRG